MILAPENTSYTIAVSSASVEPRTLQRLIDSYSVLPLTPETAQKALYERIDIIHECDAKGHHTKEELEMLDYLWSIRNAVVRQIIK
ncbi:hypothetical protein JC221_107 [Yersinia phage JC221]|nr:hypothetical protein JC221_107 [Yersinia phage JC221]